MKSIVRVLTLCSTEALIQVACAGTSRSCTTTSRYLVQLLVQYCSPSDKAPCARVAETAPGPPPRRAHWDRRPHESRRGRAPSFPQADGTRPTPTPRVALALTPAHVPAQRPDRPDGGADRRGARGLPLPQLPARGGAGRPSEGRREPLAGPCPCPGAVGSDTAAGHGRHSWPPCTQADQDDDAFYFAQARARRDVQRTP